MAGQKSAKGTITRTARAKGVRTLKASKSRKMADLPNFKKAVTKAPKKKSFLASINKQLKK